MNASRRQLLACALAMATSAGFQRAASAARVSSSTKPPQTRRALLIGINEYTNLPARFQLQGPRNDVRAWAQFLRALPSPTNSGSADLHGYEITTLTDGVDARAAQLPTRENIIRQLDVAVHAAVEDGVQFFYFAGHGSQTPQPENARVAEIDGLDEIFLPRDVGKWDGSRGQVTNAIIDDEIGDRFDAIRAKGTHVIAVFDCCHAATMARADLNSRDRGVQAGALGIPAAAPVSRKAPLPSPTWPAGRAGGTAKGSLTTLYASHGHQAASEERLPRSHTNPAIVPAWRGVFSFHLIAVLQEQGFALTEPSTVTEVSKRVLQRYAAEKRVQPVPRIEFTRQ